MSRAENAYWRKKLPPGFRYMLEKIGRGVCKGHPKPANVVEYIATYLEFKQSEHAAELAALPQVSYVQKLLAKKKRKEASNITAEQGEGARTRAEAIQAASAAAIAAKEPRGAESKKETDTRTSEDVLVKRPAPGGDDKRRSATKLPQAQKSVIEILYPNTSTGKIIADHKKGQVRGASHTSREEIRKETSKATEIGRQRTSESVIKTPSEPAVKSLSQPVVKVPSQSTVKDQSHSFTPHTSIEPAAGNEQEEQVGTAVVLIDSQKQVAHVSHQQTSESLLATKSPSQPTVKVPSYTFASQAPIVKSSSQLVVKSHAQLVVKVSSQSTVTVPSHSLVPPAHVEPSADTEQEEPAKETVAQIDAQGEVAHVSQQQIAEEIPASKAPSQPVVQAPSQIIVKSRSQPAVNCPSQSAVKVSDYSIVPQAPIEPSTGREQESPAEKTVIQTEPDREVAHVSQEQIVESVIAKKSPSKPVGNVPSQQFVKVPSESLITFPSQLAIKTPSAPAVKKSQAAANVTSQPIAPKAFRELEEQAEERVVQVKVLREIVQVSHQQIAESIPVTKTPSQPIVEAISQQEIVKVPSLPSVKVPSHSVVKVPSQPTVKAPSQLIVNLSQPDLKVTSESVASRPAVESAEDRELEESVKQTVIQTEVQKEIAPVSQQQIDESIPTVKTPSQPVVKALSQQVINVPLQPAVKASSQQIVKDSSHSVDKAPSQQVVKASPQTAVKTSHPNVKVPSQSFAPQVPVHPTAGREPEEAAKETTVPAELQRNVAQVSQQQIAESIAKAPSQKVLSQPVVKSPSRPAVKATSQQIVKVSSHSVVKAPSQPTVKATSHQTVKTSQPAVKIPSQRIASRAPIEPTSDRELEKPAKETVLLADDQREFSQVSKQQIAESIPTTKASSQPVVKTLSQPTVKSTSRPSVKASSQHIVKGPSLSTVKVPSHSVVKAPSQPTVKAPSQPTVKVPSKVVESAAGREMDEPGKETVARVEVQMEIAQVSQQQIAESMSDGKVKARSQPAMEVPSQSAVKISSQLIASLEPMELSAGKIQVEPADKTITKTEDSLRTDIPGQPIEETNPLDETEVEGASKTEEIVQSPLDQPVIISTQAPVAVAESPANEPKTESELVKLTEQTLAERMENVGIPEVAQTGDEGKVFGAEIDLTFEAETVSSLVTIKAEAEEEKEEPLHIEVDREERKELITYGDVPAHEHLAPAFGDLANETQIHVLQALAEGTGQETSLPKTKASVSHLSLEEASASVQEAKSNEPDISPALIPTEGTDAPVIAYAKKSEVPASHVATEEGSVSLHEAPFKELEDSSHLSSEEAYAPLEEARANESAEQPQTTEAFVKEPETASLKSSAEKCKDELSEISTVVVCHRSLSIELNTIEADIQAEVSETYNADVCQRRLSIDPTATNLEDQVEVFKTSKVAVLPRRISIDQTVTEAEGEVGVSEKSKDSVCQKGLPLDAEFQRDATETCEIAVCQRMISITEPEADSSKDPSNAALCQRKLSLESTNTEAETRAEVSEISSKEPGLQALWPPTEELATQADISETLDNEPTVPKEEPEGYVSNVPAENLQGYIQKTFPQESELPSSQASLEESTSTAPVLEASSQEHESLASNVPSEELQMPVMKTCSNEPEAFPPSEEPLTSALKVPSEEPQVSSQASEPPAN